MTLVFYGRKLKEENCIGAKYGLYNPSVYDKIIVHDNAVQLLLKLYFLTSVCEIIFYGWYNTLILNAVL